MTALETPTAEQIRDALLIALDQAVKRGEVKGVALVQGLKALATLAEKTPEVVADDGPQVDLLTVIDSLPPEHAYRLLDRDLTRLEHLVPELEARAMEYMRLMELLRLEHGIPLTGVPA